MNQTRRACLGQAGAGLAAAACQAATRGAAEAPRRPNLLVILTDQQHAGMLSCAGNPYLKTPHMDSLAATGTRFERACCSDPACVPCGGSRLGDGPLPEHAAHRVHRHVQPGPGQHLREFHLAEHGTQSLEALDEVSHEFRELVDRLQQPNQCAWTLLSDTLPLRRVGVQQ